MTEQQMIPVLNAGYCRLVCPYGDDLIVVNAARASFKKESKKFGDNDRGLLAFLAKKNHMSPFRHAFLNIEWKAPMMVARQLWKYVVGSDHTMDAWNEASRRYITLATEYYVPTEWRSAPENKKQGSSGPMSNAKQEYWGEAWEQCMRQSVARYNEALNDGMAPEMARGFLHADFIFITWRQVMSVQTCMHILAERIPHDAQWETQQYALALREHFASSFPQCYKAAIDCGKVPAKEAVPHE